MENDIIISIVIPVKNGVNTLPSCLDAIKKQTIYKHCEVIVIDSGSSDGTLELLKSYPMVKLYQISPEDFNHGATRNYGVSLAKGEFVVMTVQDAVAADEYWLEKLLRNFGDIKVAGVCGQQVVPHHKDKNPHEWFRPQNPPSKVEFYFAKSKIYKDLSASEKNKICSWDDVNSMYRKSSLGRIPFKPVMFGEDMLWANEAMLNGLKIIYDRAAKVEHYHSVDYDYQYRRTFTVLYHRFKFFGYQIQPIFNRTDYLKILYRNFKYRAAFKWVPYNFVMQRAYRRALKDFNIYLSVSEEYLDKKHGFICKTAPMAIAKIK